MSRCVIFAFLALLLLPTALATGGLPVGITYEAEGRPCGDTMSECVVDIDAGSDEIGDEYVDVSQQLNSVRVQAHDDVAGDPLPQDDVIVDASRIYVEHPLFVLATHAWRSAGPSSPVPHLADTNLDERGLHLHYIGPVSGRPQSWGIGYHEQGVGYKQLGPYNDFGGNTSDAYLDQLGVIGCAHAPFGNCSEWHQHASSEVTKAAPNVRVGFAVRNITVASEATNGTTRDTGPASSIGARLPRPALPLARGQTPRAVDDTPASTPATSPVPATAVLPPPAPGPRPRTLQAENGPPPPTPATWAIVGGTLLALALVAAAFYARIRGRKAALKSPLRTEILRLVNERPGTRLSLLARAVGLSRTATLYHLRVLEREGLMRLEKVGWNVLAQPGGAQSCHTSPLELHPVAARMLARLREAGSPLPRAHLHAAARDVPLRTRNYLIRRLEEGGLLVRVGTASEERYALAISFRAPP